MSILISRHATSEQARAYAKAQIEKMRIVKLTEDCLLYTSGRRPGLAHGQMKMLGHQVGVPHRHGDGLVAEVRL